mmetsp:Transcript_58031/g.166434  ORF Transcript_58031/g.166434 Transcript_58031/m.166434 type:complete len:209 (-) Transcript_58031:314-940(-)
MWISQRSSKVLDTGRNVVFAVDHIPDSVHKAPEDALELIAQLLRGQLQHVHHDGGAIDIVNPDAIVLERRKHLKQEDRVEKKLRLGLLQHLIILQLVLQQRLEHRRANVHFVLSARCAELLQRVHDLAHQRSSARPVRGDVAQALDRVREHVADLIPVLLVLAEVPDEAADVGQDLLLHGAVRHHAAEIARGVRCMPDLVVARCEEVV